MDYTAWKKQVDAALEALCGVDSNELPDFGYADAFAAEESPKSVAKAALKAARDF